MPSYFPGVGAGDSGGRVDSLPAWAWAVGYTRILTPTLTNQFHVGMVHSDKLQVSVWGNDFGGSACSGTVNPGPGSCNIPLEYGIQGVPQAAGNGGLPVISIGSRLRALGVGNFSPTLQYVWSLEYVDGVTKVWRNHAFKTGIQVDDLEGNISQPPQGRGDMSFNGQYTDISTKSSGLNGISDMLVTPINYEYGVGAGVNLVGGQNGFSASNLPVTDDHRWYIGAYFQDDWKVNPKLTLNLGVRWDLFTPYHETRGFQSNFVPAGGNGLTANFYIPNGTCSTPRATIFNTVAALSNINIVCSANAALGNAQKTNFAPRVGFAYKLRPTLVVRGGFGTAYGALGNLGYGGTLGLNYPFGYTQTIPSPDSNHPLLAGSSNAPATLENTFNNFNFASPTTLQSPTPYTTTPVSCSTLPLSTCVGGQYIGSDYLGATLNGRQSNYQTPMIQTENFTVEDQFTSHDALQAGYVGNPGPSPGYSGNLEQQLHHLASRPKHPVVYSVPVYGAERHLRNHERQHQLQLLADHLSAPDELWADGAGQLHLIPLHGRPARAAELGVQRRLPRPMAGRFRPPGRLRTRAMPTPPTSGTPLPPTACPSAVASSSAAR